MHGYLHAAEVWGIDADVFAGWGQWFGAVGSILAVGVALWVALRDSRRRDAERRDQEKAQARTITSRVGPKPESKLPLPSVIIENHGTAPITNVVLESVSATIGDQLCTKWAVYGPTGEHVDQSPCVVATVVGPGNAGVRSGLRFADLDKGKNTHLDGTRAVVTYTFTDATGLSWRKVGNGEPRRRFRDAPGEAATRPSGRARR